MMNWFSQVLLRFLFISGLIQRVERLNQKYIIVTAIPFQFHAEEKDLSEWKSGGIFFLLIN